MKNFSILTLAIFLLTATMPVLAHGPHKRCSMGERGGSVCKSCGEKSCGKSECPIISKLMKKACFLSSNAAEIGLSEDQVKRVSAISMEVKKQAILGKAQMQVAYIDMTAKLHEEPLDIEGLNKMVDEFSAGMAASTKKNIQTYAELKSIITPEQKAKAKEIWKKSMK